MNANILLLSSPVEPERLAWIEEALKFFFVQLHPDALAHQKAAASPVFTIFLTGDALYSLANPETLQFWNVILSFPPVRLICDRQEAEMRGIATDPLKMRYPDQVHVSGMPGSGSPPSFWRDLAAEIRPAKAPLPGTAGWFQTGSPYMHQTAAYGIRFLEAALGERLSLELYAYLDGIHMGHQGQSPPEGENIGKTLGALHERAVTSGLTFHATGCSNSAAARGYSTWDDGKGQVISTCTERMFRIRAISSIAERFTHPLPVLSADAGILRILRQGSAQPYDRAEMSSSSPPVTILVTRSPYGTEYTAGAIVFAVACAHEGILTRVIFIEDGVLALAGIHRPPSSSPMGSIPDLINLVAGNPNLHFFALTPSFQKRGLHKEPSLSAVPDIGYPGLGKILFYPPGNVQADHQRVLFF